ncbi:MAG: hypothetical protein V1799_16980 [bacterium]
MAVVAGEQITIPVIAPTMNAKAMAGMIDAFAFTDGKIEATI